MLYYVGLINILYSSAFDDSLLWNTIDFEVVRGIVIWAAYRRTRFGFFSPRRWRQSRFIRDKRTMLLCVYAADVCTVEANRIIHFTF